MSVIIGNDTVDDVFVGTINDDTISGLGGNDQLDGNAGQDFLDGGAGNDVLIGGAGNDSVLGGGGNDNFSSSESTGNDTLIGGLGNDTFGDFTGDNRMVGGDGNDWFWVFNGSSDSSTITGGTGADEYKITNGSNGSSPIDFVVTDFAVGASGDKLDVDDLLSLSASNGSYAGGNPFAQGFLRLEPFNPNTTLLQFDADGADTNFTWVTHLTLQNTTAVNFTADNFFGSIPPNGDTVPGLTLTGNDTLNDVLTGGFYDDTISGLGGDDQLNGKPGADILHGGAGNDVLIGGAGNDSVLGGGGNDNFSSSESTGNDTLIGGLGNDTFGDFTGDNRMVGGDGNDWFWVFNGSSDSSTITGGTGADEYKITNGSNGSSPIDFVVTDFAVGASGDKLDVDDLLSLSASNGSYAGGNPFAQGFLRLEPFNPNTTLLQFDADGADTNFTWVTHLTLQNTTAVNFTADNFFGSIPPNGDTVPGLTLTGNDTLNDVLTGGFYDDTISGLGGDDQLNGKPGADILHGGAGNDVLIGGAGNDSVLGGGGNDNFSSSESTGNDTLIGGLGNDTFGDFTGDNRMVGGDGNDWFWVFNGSSDSSTITGGTGADEYKITNGSNGSSPIDFVVTDFAAGAGGDLLDVDDLLNLSAQNESYAGGNPFAQGFLQLLQFDPNTTLLQFDADGADTNFTWVTHLTLKNVTASNINSDNFTGKLVEGTSGNDLLLGGPGNDTVLGFAGNDTLDGAVGKDTMEGGSGNDLYYVDDAGDDVIEINNDLPGALLLPGAGLGGGPLSPFADTLLDGIIDTVIAAIDYSIENLAFIENLTLSGTATQGTGNALPNLLTGNALANALFALDGDDTLSGGDGDDTLDGGPGEDTADYSTAPGAVMVNLVSDSVQDGSGGTDTLIGIEHVIVGSAFNNAITGDTNANQMGGGSGNDTLFGDAGNDTLDGGIGNDSIWGGNDNDSIQGGEGNDTVQGNAGDDMVRGSLGDDEVRGGQGNDTVQGGAGFDVIRGALGNDEMRGGLDNDTLFGGQGNDTQFGGQGSDVLQGLLGNDVLNGLLHHDQFWFNNAGPTNADIIDFGFGGVDTDTIVLQAVFFTALAGSVGGAPPATSFVSGAGAAAADADDFILYDTATGNLSYDADGNGGGAALLVATLTGAPAITDADFLIVA